MTISASSNRISYAGNGVTTAFSFPYKFLANADLVVLLVNDTTDVSTTQTITTHYTVTGAGDDAGGTVTMVTAPATDYTLVIYSDPAISQATDLVDNGPMPAASYENALDKLTLIARRLKDLIGRSFTFADSDTSGASLTVPTPTANNLIGWNSGATGLENKVAADISLVVITSFIETLIDDATADEVRATLEIPGRNRIIGGDFATNPWQRGTTFTSAASGAYTADRFSASNTSAAVVDVLKTADAPTASAAGVYTSACLHVDVTTADAAIAAGDVFGMVYAVEGYDIADLGFGQSGTRYVTLSFWVKSTVTGTYCVSFRNSAADRSYIGTYTVDVADTWEFKTITVAVDTAGTWLYTTGVGLSICFTLAAGSTFQTTGSTWAAGNYIGTSAQANALSSTSNNFKLALIQLEAGQEATPFDARPVALEMALCERYFEMSYDAGTAPATTTDNSQVGFRANGTAHREPVRYRTRKRSAPTITLYNPSSGASGSWRDLTAGANRAVAASADGSAGFTVDVTASVDTNSMGGHWTADAEL
jgi:hypothetical protein